jgi:hypothetical protein
MGFMCRRTVGVLALALVVAGCRDSTGPDVGIDESLLQFVRFPAAPPVETLQVSFWAKRGENREAVIRYLPEEPGREGREFLEFRVPGDALLRRPDGRVFADGDSIRITITLSEDGRFLVDMQPSGLVFAADRPARLRMRYDRLGGDLNGDGRVDDDDSRLDEQLMMWKQERPGSRWFPVGTVRFKDQYEIEGRITSFTGFCIAG